MDASPNYSHEEFSINIPQNEETKIMKSAPLTKQLGIILKMSFLQRLRASTITLEIILPIIFFIFLCLFAARVDPRSDSLPHPPIDPIIPFSEIIGPSPSYGMIPKNDDTQKFIDILNEKATSPIKPDVIYFDTFDEYKSYIFDNKEVSDMFYCSEWHHSDDFHNNSIRISSNGMTIGSLPFLVQNLASTIMNITTSQEPSVFLNYKKYPHSSVFKSDHDNALFVAIFGTVPCLVCILTTGTYYGTEAENGLRDLLTFFGLSFFINEVRWYILSVVILFIISIPFTIALTFILKLDFLLILIFYFLSSTSYSSFLFFMMSLWPRRQMGDIVSYGILFSLFICIFWGFFDWLFKEEGFTIKYILSILPNVALSFTLAQIGSGDVTKLKEINGPPCYPVKNGFIYLGVESVVYFCLYILIEAIKTRLWLPAPIKWGKPLRVLGIENMNEERVINVDSVFKRYKETVAVNDVSFNVKQGETLAIVGPNGAGKSTLIGLLSGTLRLEEGRIFFKGIEIKKNTRKIHQFLGFCPQKNLFIEELTVDEWLHTICILRNEPNFDYEDILKSLGLEEQRKQRLGRLSGGNKRKVCLAASLVCHPPIVVLDEATSGVDFTSRTRIWTIISSLTKTTVIMATHTLEECEKIADRIMVVVNGKIVYLETPNKLREIFKCGYLIISDEGNADELGRVASESGINNSVSVDEGKAKLKISADESVALSHILKNINFKYILSIQSLEETVFNHIQKHELEQLHRSNDGENEGDNSISESGLLSYNHPKV